MFDIGVLEIGLITVVALLVIGPERLPAVARTVGFWFGKGRKFVMSVQEDFNREIVKSEELKNLIEEQAKIKDVHEIIEQTVDETRKSVSVTANLTPPLETFPDDSTKENEESDNKLTSGDDEFREQKKSEEPEESEAKGTGSN